MESYIIRIKSLKIIESYNKCRILSMVVGVLRAESESAGIQTMARISQNVFRSVSVSVSHGVHRGKDFTAVYST